jgi:hypothetical protein
MQANHHDSAGSLNMEKKIHQKQVEIDVSQPPPHTIN